MICVLCAMQDVTCDTAGFPCQDVSTAGNGAWPRGPTLTQQHHLSRCVWLPPAQHSTCCEHAWPSSVWHICSHCTLLLTTHQQIIFHLYDPCALLLIVSFKSRALIVPNSSYPDLPPVITTGSTHYALFADAGGLSLAFTR